MVIDLQKFAKERWYFQGINAVPAFIHAGPVSAIFVMKDSLGFNYSKFMLVFKNDFCDYVYNREDLHNVADNIVKRYKKDKNYTKFLLDKSLEEAKPFLEHIKKVVPKIKEMTDEELLNNYKEFSEIFYSIFGASHSVEGFSLTSDVLIKDMLMKTLQEKGLDDKFTEYFNLLMQPTRSTFNLESNNMMHRMIELYKEDEKGKKLGKLIDKYVEKFYWIKYSWIGGERITKENVLEEIKEHIEKNDEIKHIDEEELQKNKEKKRKLCKELDLNEELMMYLDITEFMAYWQDDRKINILMGVCVFQDYVDELSKRSGIKGENLKYMLPDEIESFEDFDEEELKLRRKGSAFLYVDSEREILSGEKFEDFEKMLAKEGKEDDVKEVCGMCASVGKAVGKVKVCLTMDDLKKLEEGDVLVTTMTRPEFFQAMKTAAAFVTDEGGLTCHAAIVAREFNKPCIIATKNATKLLKDGDLVEVNANHGVVKVIKDEE